MNKPTQAHYVLGDSEQELQRLMRQSALYAELTESMLRSAGIRPGMRVLDVGCGAGCVSLLAASLVGASGVVVGLDRSPQSLAFARQRARAAQLQQVTFLEGDMTDWDGKQSFDALIGRFVLMYLPDPAAALRQLARHVGKGGIIAFQEMDISAAKSLPAMPLWEQCGEWIRETFLRAAVDLEMGPRLNLTFLHAGLPQPHLQLGTRLGGAPNFPAHEYIADLVASLLPMMESFGVATAATVDNDTLAKRLKQEMLSHSGIMLMPPLVSAWVKMPV